MLALHDLDVRYGKIAGTRKLSLRVSAGTTLALVGSNGAGKSSTLRAIAGLVRDYAGRISWNGEDLGHLRAEEVVTRGVAFSPEGRRVFAALSVKDNLMMGAFTRTKDDCLERIEQIYSYFPRLKDRVNQASGSLSGGEQQMLAIGRALMSRPTLFLLDEPSLGLAPIITERIGEILLEIQAREGLSVVLAEQNANWAMRLAHRAVILELGQKVMEGDASELLRDARVQEAYLGV